jgi:aspartate aminotransferase/aminotransferase
LAEQEKLEKAKGKGKMISQRIKTIDASGIRQVFDLARNLKNPVNLSIGQPDFDIPEEVKLACFTAIKKGLNKYTPTQGILSLREKVTIKLEKENKIKASPEEVLITSGTSGGLYLALAVLLDPGEEVIIFDPYFVSYKHLTNFLGAVPRYINTYPHFSLSAEKVEEVLTPKTKAIIINSPANPTGRVYSQAEIEKIVQLAEKKGIFIISDEVYEKFVYDGVFFSPGSIYERTITLNGFSKAYAMTGWRIGYAAGPRLIIQEMAKLQQYTYVCAPAPVQYAALTALDYNLAPLIKNYKQKRDKVYQSLKNYFKITFPEGGFYLFPEVPQKTSAEEFVRKAIENNLLIIPGNVFSEQATHFRISYAASEEMIEQGVEILKNLAQ